MPITVLPIIAVLSTLLLQCGTKSQTDEPANMVHIALHPSFSMPLPEGYSLKEIGLRRVDCDSQDESLEHRLELIRDEGVFVFNVPESEIGECGLLVRRVLISNETESVIFNIENHKRTEQGTREVTLTQDGGGAGLTVVLPEKNEISVARNTDWPLNFAYIENRDGLYPRVATEANNQSKSYQFKLAAIEDKGVVATSWREYGVTLTCDGWAQFLACDGADLTRFLARLVRVSDVDIDSPAQVRVALAQSSLQFESTISHFIGSGLRFTILFPLSWQSEDLYLIVGRNEGYNVFRINQELVSAANQ